MPYSLSDPVVLDLWSVIDGVGAPGVDGYEDSIYVGDMNGMLYGIKLNFLTSDASSRGIFVDLWKVKPIPVNAASDQRP